jgi:hypothetical protein
MFGWFRRRARRGAFLIGVPVILAGGLAFAGMGGHGPCGGPPDPAQMADFARERVGEALTAIDATPEQKEAITAIVDEGLTQAQDLHERGHALRGRVKEAMGRNASREELEVLRQEGIALADEGSRLMLDRVSEVRGQLTDAQWQKLQAMHDAPPWRRW